MGERVLEVAAWFIADLLQVVTDSPPRRLVVIRATIPAKHRIISVCQSPYWPNTVELLIESEEWDPAPPRTKISPQVAVVAEP
jgi:hypothetical protein